ncbi:hypothetical protein H6F43_17495 [Leptolyngbya sp. FACHB-36]|uniref:hypothetical protein n=1 Tax=Leptolyngbya sp. FACHB-36 TaxID=2692808 RepID=UPI001680A65C|nr:hypothetical protein [Leptolyngbya sp. FACHB-36]MBD2021976.1 hypothetical protein [Leptolyngbya sp. FACHB-36]
MRGYWLGTLLGLGAAFVALPAMAAPVQLQVFKAISAQETRYRCPETVTVMQQSQPYREGGYTIDGSARLSWLAEKFAIAASDEFSVTWVGTLKSPYRQCKATAGMVKQADDEYGGPSYLRMRFAGGKVYLILDMTGMRDANRLTPAITRKAVQNGSPVWSWSGTD